MSVPASLICFTIILLTNEATAFLSPSSTFIPVNRHGGYVTSVNRQTPQIPELPSTRLATSGTALHVWWFGGTEQNEINDDEESCELVAVRIERTSANSRRIAGDITVQAPLEDVWAILTDYNRLATHIPNLVESKIVTRNSPGQNGDGLFKCRLYQRGAQKIIGFEFGASVTMDMAEQIVPVANRRDMIEMASGGLPFSPQEKRIRFKCVESQFFSEFDGEWKAKEQIGPDGQIETVCYYVVDVRPKGPVPVAALEWRIREDVPTNLRAVKAAAMSVGAAGVLALNNGGAGGIHQARRSTNGAMSSAAKSTRADGKASVNKKRQEAYKPAQPLLPVMSDWDRDETMAKYL
jgi:hypothetical protein